MLQSKGEIAILNYSANAYYLQLSIVKLKSQLLVKLNSNTDHEMVLPEEL